MPPCPLRRLLSGLVPLIALVFAGSLPPSTAGATTPPAATLDAYRADFVRAYLAGDAAPLLPYEADDVRLMPEYEPTVLGRAAVTAYHRAFLARFEVRACTRTPREILDLGPQFATTGTFTLSLVRRDTHAPLELAGKYLELWTVSATDAPRLIASAWNYDRPVADADALRFAEVPSVNVALQPHLPIRTPLLLELAALNTWMGVVISQHDGALWAQLYSDDAVLLHNHGTLSAGRAEIDAHLAHHVREVPIFEHLDLRNDRVDDLGRYVVEYASHVANWRAGDASGVNTGKDLRLWRREPGGSLRIFRHIGMYD